MLELCKEISGPEFRNNLMKEIMGSLAISMVELVILSRLIL